MALIACTGNGVCGSTDPGIDKDNRRRVRVQESRLSVMQCGAEGRGRRQVAKSSQRDGKDWRWHGVDRSGSRAGGDNHPSKKSQERLKMHKVNQEKLHLQSDTVDRTGQVEQHLSLARHVPKIRGARVPGCQGQGARESVTGSLQAKRMRPCGNSDGNNAGSPESRLLQLSSRGSIQDLKAEGPRGPMGNPSHAGRQARQPACITAMAHGLHLPSCSRSASGPGWVADADHPRIPFGLASRRCPFLRR